MLIWCYWPWGLSGPVKSGLLDSLGLHYDHRGNVTVDEYFMTNKDGVFATGDTKRGASLIVWAIAEGRKAAAGVHHYLQAGKSFRLSLILFSLGPFLPSFFHNPLLHF